MRNCRDYTLSQCLILATVEVFTNFGTLAFLTLHCAEAAMWHYRGHKLYRGFRRNGAVLRSSAHEAGIVYVIVIFVYACGLYEIVLPVCA